MRYKSLLTEAETVCHIKHPEPLCLRRNSVYNPTDLTSEIVCFMIASHCWRWDQKTGNKKQNEWMSCHSGFTLPCFIRQLGMTWGRSKRAPASISLPSWQNDLEPCILWVFFFWHFFCVLPSPLDRAPRSSLGCLLPFVWRLIAWIRNFASDTVCIL